MPKKSKKMEYPNQNDTNQALTEHATQQLSSLSKDELNGILKSKFNSKAIIEEIDPQNIQIIFKKGKGNHPGTFVVSDKAQLSTVHHLSAAELMSAVNQVPHIHQANAVKLQNKIQKLPFKSLATILEQVIKIKLSEDARVQSVKYIPNQGYVMRISSPPGPDRLIGSKSANILEKYIKRAKKLTTTPLTPPPQNFSHQPPPQPVGLNLVASDPNTFLNNNNIMFLNTLMARMKEIDPELIKTMCSYLRKPLDEKMNYTWGTSSSRTDAYLSEEKGKPNSLSLSISLLDSNNKIVTREFKIPLDQNNELNKLIHFVNQNAATKNSFAYMQDALSHVHNVHQTVQAQVASKMAKQGLHSEYQVGDMGFGVPSSQGNYVPIPDLAKQAAAGPGAASAIATKGPAPVTFVPPTSSKPPAVGPGAKPLIGSQNPKGNYASLPTQALDALHSTNALKLEKVLRSLSSEQLHKVFIDRPDVNPKSLVVVFSAKENGYVITSNETDFKKVEGNFEATLRSAQDAADNLKKPNRPPPMLASGVLSHPPHTADSPLPKPFSPTNLPPPPPPFSAANLPPPPEKTPIDPQDPQRKNGLKRHQ